MGPHPRGNRESQFHSNTEDWDPDTTLPQYHQNGITLHHWMVFYCHYEGKPTLIPR